MHIKLKRGMSLLMAAALSMSGVVQAVAAEEIEDLSTIYETVMRETEVPFYEFTLPYQEECIYQFEEEHLKEPVQDKQEIVLLYEAEEKVEFTLQVKNDWQLDQIHLINQTKTELPFEWKEDGCISFLMPAEAVWMEADFLRMEETVESENMTEISVTETAEDRQEPGEQMDDITEEPSLEELPVADPSQENPASDASAQEKEDIVQNEPEQETEKLPYQEETDAEDGLPMQGSIVQVESISIPFDTWDFDQYTDFRNIPYSTDCCIIEYISDDIIYDAVGTYSSIYKVTDQGSGKFWFVLRPVQVLEAAETVPEQESELLQELQTEVLPENRTDITLNDEKEKEPETDIETVQEPNTEMEIKEEQESEDAGCFL